MIKKNYNNAKRTVKKISPGLYFVIDRYKTIIKFFISGGTAAATDIILLFLFTDIFNIHYLISAGMAFIIAFFVSFFLQKFWSFRDDTTDKIYKQMSQYFAVGLTNLLINTMGMYFLVEIIKINYILAQIVMGGLIACISFILYRYIIFRKPKEIK
jgi:putative flippase GtrA